MSKRRTRWSEALAKQVFDLVPAWLVMLTLPVAARLGGQAFPVVPLVVLLALPPAVAVVGLLARATASRARGARPPLAERSHVVTEALARRCDGATAGTLWLSRERLVYAVSSDDQLSIPLAEIAKVEARDVGTFSSLLWFRPEAFNVVVRETNGQVHRFDVAAPVSFVELVREHLTIASDARR
jgi:hypothetical protein